MREQPHDKLFRSTFSQVEHARGFLKTTLPVEISSEIQWDSLQLQPGTYIDEQLKELQSDLLFETTIGEESALLYILAEHKSEQDLWVMLQLLQYQVSIWKQWRSEHPKVKYLPLIIPLVVCHAKGGWKVSRQFSDLFSLNESLRNALGKYLPSFECVVEDLTERKPEDLQRLSELSAFTKLVIHLLKGVRESHDVMDVVDQPWVVEVMREIEGLPEPEVKFAVSFTYLFQVKEISTQEEKKLLDFVNQHIGKKAKEGVMTGADRLRAEGIEKGRAEGEIQGIAKGRAEGKAKTVQNLLRLKFRGQVTEADLEKVMQASEAELDRITELVLSDASLETLLDF